MALLPPPPSSRLSIKVCQSLSQQTSVDTHGGADGFIAYGMSLDLGAFLAAYGTVFNGDALSLTPGYSIGGPACIGLLGGLLSGTGITRTPSGLSGSHNNYEGDTSATRGDQYVVCVVLVPLFLLVFSDKSLYQWKQ